MTEDRNAFWRRMQRECEDLAAEFREKSKSHSALSNTPRSSAIDRENNVIKGYVVAQVGNFKTPGRGRFNSDSLWLMPGLWPAGGLKCRFTHPGLFSDGLGSLIGRSVNPRIVGNKLIADLRISPTSFRTPRGNLGQYIMDLAEQDPDAFASSLVLKANEIYELDSSGRPIRNEKGEELPPLWMPTKLWASDLVDTGDAVDSFLYKQTPTSVLAREHKLRELKDRFEGAASHG